MFRRLFAASALLTLALLAGGWAASPAGALPYPPTNGAPVLTASAYDPCAGASNVIGGHGYQPGETVQLVLLKTGEIARVVVQADGSFLTTVTIPLSERGSDQVVATGLTSGLSAQLRLDIPCVLGQGDGGPASGAGGGSAVGGGLASTGAAVGGAALLGVVLVGAGAVTLTASRRRRGAR